MIDCDQTSCRSGQDGIFSRIIEIKCLNLGRLKKIKPFNPKTKYKSLAKEEE